MAQTLPGEVIDRFRDGLDAARKAGEIEPTAMSLATRSADGGVSSRMVLLKDFDERGFVFYTNLNSPKGRQLAKNPSAALVLHWKAVERQVRVEGKAEPVSEEEADAYFASRPRGSRLGAWASLQSQPLKSRATLMAEVAKLEARYLGRAIPRPPHWSGYRVVPHMVEFWYGRKSRLHDRFRFTLTDGEWMKERLYP